MLLEKFLVTELFAVLFVFCRLGAAVMLLPGIGEVYVNPRARLLFALCLSLIVAPVVSNSLPPMPGAPLMLAVLITKEVLIGLFIGLLSRILISAMHTAGMIIAFQSGLASAMMFDINAGTQGSAFGNLLSLTAVMLLFASDMHHLMFMGIADSYTLIAPGATLPAGDFATMAASITGGIFLLATVFAGPHLAMGLFLYLGSGILSRLMPTMQVFFILMPAQILTSVFILTLSITSGMLVYMNYFEKTLIGFLAPGSNL